MLLLHLSDIHFNNRDVDKPYDQNSGLRDDTINDVKEMREKIGKNVDAILISGDIAYHGQESEYDYAWKWLTVNRLGNGTPYRLPRGTPASGCIGSARVGLELSI